MPLTIKDIGKNVRVLTLHLVKCNPEILPLDPQYPFTLIGIDNRGFGLIHFDNVPEIVFAVAYKNLGFRRIRHNQK